MDGRMIMKDVTKSMQRERRHILVLCARFRSSQNFWPRGSFQGPSNCESEELIRFRNLWGFGTAAGCLKQPVFLPSTPIIEITSSASFGQFWPLMWRFYIYRRNMTLIVI